MNRWRDVRDYFGSFKIGKTVKRQEYITYFFSCYKPTDLDVYRAYLSGAGYLKTVSPGTYKIIKKIPVDLSLKQAKMQAYGKV